MDFSKAPKDFLVTMVQYTKHVYSDQYPAIDPTKPENSLAGKVVIITGASRGIGAKGFAPAFTKAGVKGLVLTATNLEKLNAVAAEVKKINPSVEVLVVPVNIADEKSVASLFEQVKSTFGHADILVNNAGVANDQGVMSFADADPDAWWSNFEINGKGPFLTTREFVRQLPSPETPATVINLTTSGAWLNVPHMMGYGMSKLLPIELAKYTATMHPNITAVAVHPGLLETDMLMDAFRSFNLETPELLGGLGVWLSQPRAHFLSGKTIASQWSVEDLLERQEEIKNGTDLVMQLAGKFGPQQFA